MVATGDVGVLWATHLLDEVLPDDRVTVLHRGRVLADQRAATLAGSLTLGEAFLRLTGFSSEALA